MIRPILYIETKENGSVTSDALSRLPMGLIPREGDQLVVLVPILDVITVKVMNITWDFTLDRIEVRSEEI